MVMIKSNIQGEKLVKRQGMPAREGLGSLGWGGGKGVRGTGRRTR